MAHVLTPAATLDSVTVPDPGDARTAASVTVGMQNLLNRTDYMMSRIPELSNAVNRQMPVTGGNSDIEGSITTFGVPGWTWDGTKRLWIQTDVASAAKLHIDLQLPVGALITNVSAGIRGSIGAAHAGNVATPPTIVFQQLDPASSLGTTVDVTASATGTDSTGGNLGLGYDGVHVLSCTPNITTLQAARYCVMITGETGANSAAGKLALYGISVSWTAPV